MMPFGKRTSISPLSETPDGGYMFYCTLFDDMILKNLCFHRRRELNGKDGFSCAGCSKDTIINNLRVRRHAPRT